MRKLLPLLMIACLAGAIVAVPVASAKPAHTAKTNSTKQLKKNISKANKSIKKLAAALAVLTGSNKSNADSIKTIIDGVPAIVNGLTALKDGLTTLGAAYQSVEYGVLHTVVNIPALGGNVADMPKQFSADIPDDGNGAQVSGDIPFTAPGTTTINLNVRAAIRSAEADGKATGDPAGEVGGLIYATCASAGGCGAADTAGAIVCTPGQTPANYNYKNPSSGNTSVQQLVPIQLASGRTDQSRPSDDPTDLTTVDATAGSRCSFTGVAGKTYIVHTTFQFFDLPTSTTPGATD
jgi:hypothetical protein